MTIEQVQQTLHRSRASIYRYVNTDNYVINPPFDPNRLNPEHRSSRREPLLFHPNEVARFARDVMGITNLHVEIQTLPEDPADELLGKILTELQKIRQLLEQFATHFEKHSQP
ncbi:hypothetical protein RYO59_000800 [Thermosynechococcaceae cyanobacterium Okahandja]